ncbi:MAG: proteasome accessory factor PafA2 family protein [Armatimonadetes bacterium]|nr:proteasome accessory factor PafA2 family protein [Armatimonadota bacterium]
MPDGLNRIFGVETEFGCLVDPASHLQYEQVVEAVKDHVFHTQRLGAIDLQPRDEAFEPAFSGGFLINGGRLYVDAVGSHEEYATPECRSVFDLIASDRAGQRLIQRALEEVGLADIAWFYNNSVDHFGGHTFGCHENYLVKSIDGFLNDAVQLLYPFLVTRQIYAGVGRVGGHRIQYSGTRLTGNDLRNVVDYIWVSNVYGVDPDESVTYQLSQRADHIIKTIASRVRFNRALINPKWESFYSYGDTTRLHLLFGEPNQMQYAYALKVGTTCLILDLVERGMIPTHLRCADPLGDLKNISRDPTYKWMITLEDGTTLRACDLHREYIALAESFRGRDEETDWILDEWQNTISALESDPMQLYDKLDWVAKKRILDEYVADAGVDWSDDSLHSVDLEYHNLNPERSLYDAWEAMGNATKVVRETQILDAMTDPPPNTRAFARAHLVRRLISELRPTYWVDWDAVYLNRQTAVELPDPFDNYADLIEGIGK